MGTSSQFLAFFKMAPSLTCRYYAPINVKSQNGGGGGVGQGVFLKKCVKFPLAKSIKSPHAGASKGGKNNTL